MIRHRWLQIATGTLIVLATVTRTFAQTENEDQVPARFEKRLKEFFAEKEAQSKALAKLEDKEQAPEVWEFFNAGKAADWAKVTQLYNRLRRGAYQYQGGKSDPRLITMVWQPVNEAFGAVEECQQGDERYVARYSEEILASMPKGAVYFGGTDPGRWLPTAFVKSHEKADPCFVLTQNALADNLYMQYLRAMYGDRLKLPTEVEIQAVFSEYIADATKRLETGKLKPGENVERDEDTGRVNVSGQVAVMEINARIARLIYRNNPDREFYVEESFPLDWMYPHLRPNGLIMKLERQPVRELPEAMLEKDRSFWTSFVDQALGKWLTPETPLKDVCSFVEKVFEKSETDGFKGDPHYLKNDATRRFYAKLRTSIASVYAWRVKNISLAAERLRMAKAADFAFRQAFVLNPQLPESGLRYAEFLLAQGRKEDALLVAKTAEASGNNGLGTLIWKIQHP